MGESEGTGQGGRGKFLRGRETLGCELGAQGSGLVFQLDMGLALPRSQSSPQFDGFSTGAVVAWNMEAWGGRWAC